MDVRQLELFLAVIDLGSVTRAAEKMHLSPGAVSLQLHNLSSELRTGLFIREGKGLRATAQAFRLAEHARAIIRQMRQLRQEFENDPATDPHPFHFATGATTLIHRLGRPLRQLRKEYPKTPIQVTVSATEEMVAGLLDRRFDLALISLPFNEENLKILPLFEEELLVLKPSPTRVSGWHVGSVAVSELASVPFLLYPSRSNMRTIINDFFRSLGTNPIVAMEADDTEVIKRLVESGFGYSILPESALHGAPRFFQTFRVGDRRLVRTQALAMVKTDYPRALTEKIAAFLRDAFEREATHLHSRPASAARQ